MRAAWADECERANAALAAAEDQMGRTGEGHETDASLAAAEARMEKEDREWLAALEAAMALLHPRQQGPENQPPNKGRATRQKHQPPPPNGVRRTKEGTPGVKPKIKQWGNSPLGVALTAPAAPKERWTRSRWWGCTRED